MNQTDYTLFEDPCIKYPSCDIDRDFADYRAACRALVQSTRRDLGQAANPDYIIDVNTPFELRPTKPLSASTRYGALLIHGLLDAPFIMRDIGITLQAQGLLTRSILLPGHGTVPGALLHVQYQEWVQLTRNAIRQLAREVDKLFVVGFSTGASLALYDSLIHADESIAGLVLLAPAIEISPLSRIAWLPPKLTELSRRLAWLHQEPEIDYAKYASMPFNAATQVYELTKAINAVSDVNFLKHPVFVGISSDDQVVSAHATIRYFREHTTKQSQLLIYTRDPNHLQDTRIIKRPSAYPDLSISKMSHIAIPVAPDNPHYGEQGDYPLASHIEANQRAGKPVIYSNLNSAFYDVLNGLYRLGIYKHYHERLTFNPDFAYLAQSIQRFIQKIISG